MTKLADVAPLNDVLPLNHWYVRVPAPLATTFNVSVDPPATVWLSGWLLMIGGVTIVIVAAWLVTGPSAFETSTEYAPASAICADDRVNVDRVAPAIGAPFLSHWKVRTPDPAACTESEKDWP